MRIGLDVDEVLLQLHALWISLYNKDYNDTMTTEDIVHWDIHKLVKPRCGVDIFRYLTPDMYAKDLIQPYPFARMAVGQIRQLGHRISFVTSCGPNNEMAEAKEAYLRRHGFMQRWDAFIPGSDKSNAPVDLLVDDHIQNVETFNGRAVLVNRPHNIREQTRRLRVHSLAELANLLGEY